MKLAQILATSPLPGGSSARLESASTSPIAAGLAGVEKIATDIADTASYESLRAARLLATAEREKQKHQQALDASTAVNSALDTLDQAETIMKMGERDADGNLITPPLTAQEHMPAWLKLRDKLTQEALDKATTPEAKLVTAKLLETPFRERQHQARKYANDLYVGEFTVGVEENLDTYAKRAVLEPNLTTTGPRSALYGELGTLARPGGGLSTEISITVTEPALNDGRPTNIPLLVKGQQDVQALLAGDAPTAQQVGIAIRRAAQRVQQGEVLPSYDTLEAADAASIARSKEKGAGVTPLHQQPYWETRTQAELAMAKGVKGPEWVRKRWEQWTEQVDTATVLRQSETDPEGAMDRLKSGDLRLPQKRADEIAVRVGDKWDRQVRQQDAAQAKAQAEITKYQTEQYHADTSDLYANAVDGRANLQELEAWRLKHRGRAGVDEDFTRIRKAILEPAAKEAKPWKSDEATRARVVSEMERIQPSYTHEQLVNLNEQHLLNTEDLKWALGQRRRADEFQRTLGVSAEGLARTQAMQRHQQAEQELRIAILGPDSLFKSFDDKQERIYGQALRQLSSRSSAYGGREDPMTVKDELLKTFLPLAGRQTMMKATEAQAGLTFPTERALEDAYRAKRITPGYYREQQERFNVLKQAETDLKANAAQGGDDAATALRNLRGGGKGAAPAPARPRGAMPESPYGGMVSP